MSEQDSSSVEKPDAVTDEHLGYLDDLRISGVTNMFGAAPYLAADFPELTDKEARAIVVYWMKTFSARRAAK